MKAARCIAAALVALAALATGAAVRAHAAPVAVDPLAGGTVVATDELEYSYGTASRREIVENWLDVSWSRPGFSAGLLLDHQSPGEEGLRVNEVKHRFVELATHGLEIRAGHFYGMFGRGLIVAAREDRRLRVDTALDGLLVKGSHGPVRAAAFSGTPGGRDVDLRGLDAETRLGGGWSLGASGLSWRADDRVLADGAVHREWAMAPRVTATLPFGGLYAEYGWKRGWDFRTTPDDRADPGHALYAALQLFRGPLGLSLEAKDYRRFVVVRAADGRTSLNNPPSLAREHVHTLLDRAPHNLDADDERGQQAELTCELPAGWSALVNASRSEKHDGERVFEEAYAQLEQPQLGPWNLSGGFGYRESEGIRQCVVAGLGYRLDERLSLSLDAEHQHVRLGGGAGFDLGAFDEEFFKLELGVAPAWSASVMLEVNNKFREQREFGERRGPFPAAQLAYTTSDGARVALWGGKRQAGFLCAGGVCKYEPAFAGLELTASVRY